MGGRKFFPESGDRLGPADVVTSLSFYMGGHKFFPESGNRLGPTDVVTSLPRVSDCYVGPFPGFVKIGNLLFGRCSGRPFTNGGLCGGPHIIHLF